MELASFIRNATREGERFVRGNSNGKICFLPSWACTIAQSFRYRDYSLIFRSTHGTCSILPLFHVRSRLFGNRLISQPPFYSYGGPLAETEGGRDALFRRAVELARELGCDYIEFRGAERLGYDLEVRTGKLCMHLGLAGDPDGVWKGLDPKIRNQVRKAEKSGLTAAEGGAELLDEFYRLYTRRMWQLGTPCFSKRVMAGILGALPEYSRVFVVRLGDLTVGAGFTTCYNRFAEIHWGATRVEYNSLCPNPLLYWSIIRHYCLAGAKVFDFGRCTVDSSTYRFKKQWGTTEVPIYYQYWVRPGYTLSVPTADDPRYRRKIAVWKKLPLWLTRVIGPAIARRLP